MNANTMTMTAIDDKMFDLVNGGDIGDRSVGEEAFLWFGAAATFGIIPGTIFHIYDMLKKKESND